MTQIIWGGWALLNAQAAVRRDYGVVVEGARIIAVGALSELQAAYPEATVEGGRLDLLLPTFTNAHDHGRALGTASLGVPDDLLEIWLMGLGAQPSIPPDLAATYEAVQLLRTGVSLTAHSHNPASWAGMAAECPQSIESYRAAGLRVAFHPPYIDQNNLIYTEQDQFLAGLPSTLHEVARQYMGLTGLTRAEYLALCSDLHERYHDADGHTVHIQISPAGGQWCSDELILAAVDWAQAHATRVQMHMLETRYQRAYALKRWGKSFVQHLGEIGALGPWLTLAHMVWVEPEDWALLAERGVGVAHNPSSNMRLRSGIADVGAMRSAGVAVGVGLDGHGLDDDQDYWRELRLAYTLGNMGSALTPHPSPSWRGESGHAHQFSNTEYSPLTPAAVLTMGTVTGAAITLGEGIPLGRLAEGALADMMLVDWQALRGAWCPDDLPTEAGLLDFLLHRAQPEHIRQVMVNGEWVVREGRSTRVDIDAVQAEIRARLNAQDVSVRQQNQQKAVALAHYVRRFYTGWIE